MVSGHGTARHGHQLQPASQPAGRSVGPAAYGAKAKELNSPLRLFHPRERHFRPLSRSAGESFREGERRAAARGGERDNTTSRGPNAVKRASRT